MRDEKCSATQRRQVMDEHVSTDAAWPDVDLPIAANRNAKTINRFLPLGDATR